MEVKLTRKQQGLLRFGGFKVGKGKQNPSFSTVSQQGTDGRWGLLTSQAQIDNALRGAEAYTQEVWSSIPRNADFELK